MAGARDGEQVALPAHAPAGCRGGGHCIPKDPWLLVANAGDGFAPQLIPVARAINDGMPLHVADLTVAALQEVGVDVDKARVTVLGYAYLENSDDTRNSPSAALVARLRELGAEVIIHDPYVLGYQYDLDGAIEGCDAVMVMVAHDAYRTLDLARLRSLARTPVLVDGRQVIDREQAEAGGWRYRGVGIGGV